MQIPSFKLSLTDSEQPCRHVVHNFSMPRCILPALSRWKLAEGTQKSCSPQTCYLGIGTCKLGIEEAKGSIQERHPEGFTDKPSCCLLSMASSLHIDQSVGQSKPGLHALHASQETSPPLTEHLADWKQACLRLADLAAQIH